MQRSYSVQVVSLAIGVPAKWLDNLLSHHEMPGVRQTRQGVQRSISEEGVLALELVRLLASELGIGLRDACAIARIAIHSRAESEIRYTTQTGLQLSFPAAELQRQLRQQLLDAVEAAPRPARGRPRSG